MTNNPLIQKYEELYGKKEEPKPTKPPIVEYVDNGGSIPPKEVIERLRLLQPHSKIISSIGTSSITITPKPPSLVSYDVDSGNDSFLQIAEKVKNKNARVIYMNMNRDRDIMGITTIAFEVQIWDTY